MTMNRPRPDLARLDEKACLDFLSAMVQPQELFARPRASGCWPSSCRRPAASADWASRPSCRPGRGHARQRDRPLEGHGRRQEPAVQRPSRHQSGDRGLDRRSLGRAGRRQVHLRHRRLQHEGGRRRLLLRGQDADRCRRAAEGRRRADLRRRRVAGRRRHRRRRSATACRADYFINSEPTDLQAAHHARRGRHLHHRAHRQHPPSLQARAGGRMRSWPPATWSRGSMR